MTGPVDFENDANYWQQDRWSGQFPVRWHIAKDVPNGRFRHILLDNNDNKPVTHSRDSQEVPGTYQFSFQLLFFSWSIVIFMEIMRFKRKFSVYYEELVEIFPLKLFKNLGSQKMLSLYNCPNASFVALSFMYIYRDFKHSVIVDSQS